MPDLYQNTDQWVDVYAALNIAPGTPVNIQNQSGNVAYLRENHTDRGFKLIGGADRDTQGGDILEMRCAPGGINAYVQVLS